MQQRQQRSIVNLRSIYHSEPFSPSDHVGPQPIIKEQVQEDVIPPAMVCSRLVLPIFVDPVEGILGDLQLLFSISINGNEERNYLERRWIMSPSR